AISLLVDSGGEEQGSGGSRLVAIAEGDAPKPVDDDRLFGLVAQGAFELTRVDVVGVDPAVAEVADEEISPEVTEAFRREGEAPRRVECAAADQALEELAFIA